ncbi:TonB-dependent receptor domain-containing protein [Pedobacter sp. SYSU D00535]|uniref:TonB-dependent receptor domain-containing protein n=1 Tax=Pedobacter sp. SYSU D00535 TaxID=2810308 RepID=UPI001A958181|nr:outer membrane beta-barrel family protein [Pedobacter sp. SYSU D00535]
MRILITLLVVLFWGKTILAQTPSGKITGKIVESTTNNPVDFATVALVNSESGQAVKSTRTNLEGIFSLSALPFGRYTLKVSFVGYDPLNRESITITATNPQLNLGTLKLSPGKTNILKEVVVQAERSNIQLGIDRKVFNVEQSLVSEGGSATDLLANVPTVGVDIDGNVSLRGSGSVRVLIDGKPSAIGGGDIATVLQSLPASSIETIELITNPSSKYDPEGQTGIINIVLKKNKKIGINGAVSLSAGNLDNYNASTNLSYRDKNVNIYGNYSFRYGTRLGGGYNNTLFFGNNNIVNNNMDGRRQNTGNTAKAGIDYFINDQTTIGLSANINLRNSGRDEDINYFYRDLSSRLDSTSYRTSREDDEDTGYDLSLDFGRKFKNQGHELTANFSLGQSKENEIQELDQQFFNSAGTAINNRIDRRTNDGSELSKNYNVQADYMLPLSKTQKFEAGYRSTFRIEEASQYSEKYDLALARFRTDYTQTNDFNLEDIVHAVYGNYQNQVTEGFGLQVGVRAEQAYLNTEYIGTDTTTFLPTLAKGRLDYFRLYPSVFLTQKLAHQQQLQVSYTRRVNRPRGWQVNPFRDLSDPNNVRVGNPNLRPEDVHSFELNYMKYFSKFTLTTAAFARQVNDVVEGVQTRLNSGNSVGQPSGDTTLTQFINLTKNRATGLELIGRADFSKAFNVTGNFNLFYNKFFGSPEYNIAPNSGINWNTNLTASIQFPRNISAQINANYMAPRVTAQGRSKEMWGADAALRVDVLNKKGSISFNMRDVFNSRRWGFLTETSQFSRESQRRMQGRMSTLTFSYRFGQSDLQNRNRKSDRNNNQQPDQFQEEGGF